MICRWIPITERAPDKKEPVLYRKNNIGGRYGVGIAYWTVSDKWIPEAQSLSHPHGFTHWMPLPPVDDPATRMYSPSPLPEDIALVVAQHPGEPEIYSDKPVDSWPEWALHSLFEVVVYRLRLVGPTTTRSYR